ncbi:MAG: PH domain-containing protein [Pirellulales bacterium]|nr:PH domain-containing protein [Pirellulales bacterium]
MASSDAGTDSPGSRQAGEPPSDRPVRVQVLPESHSLHPSSILFFFIARIRSYLIPAIVAAFAAAAGSSFLAFLLGLGFLVAIVVDGVRLYTLRYHIAGGELVVRQGILFRQHRTIPLVRIQNIDLLQNPLHRLLGVAEVRVETASGSDPEATLRVLSLAEVDRLKHRIHDESPEGIGSETIPSMIPPDLPREQELHRLDPRDLITLGLISNRGAVLVAVAAGAFYEFELHERLDWGMAERVVRAFWPANLAVAVVVSFLLGMGVLLILRILGVFWCLLRFYGYQLTTDDENLRVHAGMFTKVSATIPRPHVQFISIHRSVLARWFSRASIRIETAGGGARANEDAQSTISRRWFLPIVRESAVGPLMGALRQGLAWNEDALAWHSVHPHAIRRLVRKSVILSMAFSCIGLVFWWPFGIFAGPILLPGLVWHAKRYAASLRYARSDTGIAFRSGVLLEKTSVTFFDKIQVVDVLQTPFDRRWNMAQLRIDTAAAGPAEHRIHAQLLEAEFARDEFIAISHLILS